MKLKHHLLIALVVIFVSLFVTSVVTTTEVTALNIDKESTTTVWGLMWENLFTDNPTEETIETLGGLGLPEAMAADLVEEHGTGTSFLSGLLGLIPILGMIAVIAGLVCLVLKKKLIKPLLFAGFAVVFVGAWVIWFSAPTKLDGIESMYNDIVPTMGTMMVEGTKLSMGLGLFIASFGALYGLTVLVLNQTGKITE